MNGLPNGKVSRKFSTVEVKRKFNKTINEFSFAQFLVFVVVAVVIVVVAIFTGGFH